MAVEESLRNTRVQELADLYFERKDGGESVSLADLCEAEPELTPEVMREIHRLLHAERILFGEGGWTFVPSRGVPGRYVVEYADVQNPEPHRSGGMGHLYIARDVETDRRVAYKVLRPELDWPLFRAEFRREAQLTAELRYDGIVPIFGLVSDDPTGLPAYAMDFVEGQTLHEEIRERKWSDARSWRIELTILLRYFLVVCRAVEFAHTQRIRHNDLKSNNVKVTPNREVFVLDWGLAVKTPGEWTSADAARDIVGLGSILHEILTNDTPKTVGKVATDPRVPRAVAPSSRLNGRPVHPHLAAVCRRALSDDPSVRYSTAAALAGDVEAWIEHRAVSAYRDWWPVRGWRWAGRHPAIATATVTAALLFAVGGSIYTYQYGQSEARRIERERARESDVATTLDQFNDHVAHDELRPAEADLQRAEGRVADSNSSVLRASVAKAREDCDFAIRLEAIRSNLSALGLRGGVRTRGERMHAIGLDYEQADREFSTAFATHGIPIDGDQSQISSSIQDSRLREQLIRTLDFWAITHISAGGPRSKHLLTLAKLADANSERASVRELVLEGRIDQAKQVARQLRLEQHTPSTLMLLSIALYHGGASPTDKEVLEQGLVRWPGDFWLNNELSLRYVIGTDSDPRTLAIATRYSQAAVACRPDSAMAHSNLSFMLASAKNWTASLAASDQAVRLEPDLAVAHLNRSRALSNLFRWEEARDACQRVLAVDPTCAVAQSNLAETFRNLGKFDEAAQASNRALELDSNLAPAYTQRAAVHWEKNEWDQAEADCRLAIKLDESLAVAWSGLGLALGEKGKFDDAMKAFDRAVRLDPEDGIVFFNRATIRWGHIERIPDGELPAQEIARIDEDLDRSLALRPKLAAAYALRGMLRARLRQPAQARDALRAANAIDPDSADGFLLEAEISRARDDAKGVVDAMRKAVKARPLWAIAHNNLASGLGLLHEYDEAIRAAREASKLDPALDTPHLSIATALGAQGRYQEAIPEYEQYMRMARSPDWGSYAVFAIALDKSGRFGEALANYERAFNLVSPKEPLRADLARLRQGGKTTSRASKSVADDPR